MIALNEKGGEVAFLLSMPRSGSTLLSMMLGSHPEVCCPPEPWILLAVAEYLDLAEVRKTPYGRDIADIAAIEFLLGAERLQRGGCAEFLQANTPSSGAHSLAVARSIAHAAYNTYIKNTGKRIFVDKTPRYYALLDFVSELFPSSRKIILLRNPLDVFASYKATWEVSREVFAENGVSVHARDFCEGLFSLADYIGSQRSDTLVLHYEDLVSDTETALRSICDFLGVNYSPAMLEYHRNAELIESYRRSPVGDPISSRAPRLANQRTVNAWRDRLDLEDIQTCVDVLGTEIFERMGYGETVSALCNLLPTIASEEEAAARRLSLMTALRKTVHEQPFSTWDNFVSALKASEADRADRLSVIQSQQAELDRVETAMAERQELIRTQQEELAGLRQHLASAEADRAARLDAIVRQQEEFSGLLKLHEASEADRAVRLEVIQRQQRELSGAYEQLAAGEANRLQSVSAIKRLQEELAVSEADRAARLESIIRLQGELASCQADMASRVRELQQTQQELLQVQANSAAQVIEIDTLRSNLQQARSIYGFVAYRLGRLFD